jgi:ParB family chromosome partitioning protein
MGRGLAAILAAAPQDQAEELRNVPVELIEPNPHQPRHQFDEQSLTALAASLEARGVLQPVLVRPLAGGRYELIAGERRWRAAMKAGLTAVPVVVREASDQEALQLALVENLQREDLNPIEEANGYRRLQQEFDWSNEQMADKVGKSRPAIANAVRLLALPTEVQQEVAAGNLPAGQARALPRSST